MAPRTKNEDTAPANPAGDGKPASNVAPLRKTVPCPECRRPSHREHYPFCSNRCRDLDLSRWLTGSYAIPVVEEDDDTDDLKAHRDADD